MQKGLPNSTGSCELARECKIIKVLHNKKNSINLTFSGNRYIQTDAQVHLYLHHLVSVAYIIVIMIHRTASNTSTSWQLQDQSIRLDHFRIEFCPILDKMTIYSSLHLYSIKSSAKYLTIFHCRERMAWIEV